MKEKNPIGDRIKEYRLLKDMTLEELAKHTGVSKATIFRYESGEISNIPSDKIELMSNALGVSPALIMGWEIINKTDISSFNKYKYFPVSISAGSLEDIEGIDIYDMITISDTIMGKYAGRKGIILLKANGESMNKIIPNGSFMVVDTTKKYVTDIYDKDIVVFANGGEGYSVKRYINDKQNKRFIFKPESTDDTFLNIVIDYDKSDDLRLIGKVVKYIVDLD